MRALSPDDTVIHAHDGREYRYIRPGRTVSQALGAAGALVQGFMGAGLPEATTTQLILRGPVPPRVAVGTSVTTLTVTVFFAAAHPRHRRRAPMARGHLVVPRRAHRRAVRRKTAGQALPHRLPASPRGSVCVRGRAGDCAAGRGVRAVVH